MCESNAYITDADGNESLIMESVDNVKMDGQTIILRSLFGEETSIEAKIKELNLTGHKLILERV
jgi:predicted RNA-binding protein